MPHRDGDPPERIAVLRANGLGDLVFAWPALVSLRKAYPSAEIVLLGTEQYRDLLTDRPGPVDRVEALPPIPGITVEPAAEVDAELVAATIDRLRACSFDVVLQLHGGGGYSNPFVQQLDPGLSVGLRASDADALDIELPYVFFQPEVMRCLEVLSLLQIEPVLQARLPVTEKDHAEVEEVLGQDLPEDRPVLTIHPGARDRRRHWPTDRFGEVADAAAAAGATIVVTGAESERQLVNAVRSGMRYDSVDGCGRLGLGGLLGLMDRSAVVLGNDSGPVHLAAGIGASTVAIFWCGNLVNAGPFGRARHRPQISWTMSCPQCGAPCLSDVYPTRGRGEECSHRGSFVEDVSTPEVLEATLDLLSQRAIV